ncbi:hypothetical protein BD410DRAFT_321840 [Rickenella mellea]|uniref:Uncharacterized protein n=1 Tax=Rickenella mellea TaxID=50990 RepID=A0A4Y7PZX8_9AGAM|nr:hypothetical protein BD410DRAFT_321840 [Rickenella mellea]
MSFNFLSNLFRNIRHLLSMASDDILYPELPHDPTPIETYVGYIQARYEADGTQRMRDFEVSQLGHYKSHDTYEHEYLTATLKNRGETFYVAFDRVDGVNTGRSAVEEEQARPQVDARASSSMDRPSSSGTTTSPVRAQLKPSPLASAGRKQSKAPQSSGPQSSGPQSSGPQSSGPQSSGPPSSQSPGSTNRSLNKFYRSSADDKVLCIPHAQQTPKDTLHVTVTFASPISLYELAVLVQATHKYFPIYRLGDENCYFFVGFLVDAVLKRYHGNAVKSIPPKKGKGKVGQWGPLSIYPGSKPEDIQKCLEKFEVALEKFKEPIQCREDARNDLLRQTDNRLQEADSRVQEADSRVQEADNRTRQLEDENTRLRLQLDNKPGKQRTT